MKCILPVEYHYAQYQKKVDALQEENADLRALLRDLRVHRQTLDACNPEIIHRIDAALAKLDAWEHNHGT